MILRLAFRNLGRHRRRTLITASAIAFGLGLLIFSSGMGDGAHNQMIRTGIRQSAGHVVIQGQGFQESRDAELVVPNTPAVIQALKRAIPDGLIVQRVFAGGLLTSPTGSVGVGVVGVQPGVEADLSDLDEKLVEGAYLDGGEGQIVLGVTLAETLGVDLGDKVVLMASQAGEIESRLFRVKGIYRTGSEEIDGFFGHIPLQDAQVLLGLGDDVSQLSVHVDSVAVAPVAVGAARDALSGQAVEVLSWQEALPELYQYIVIDDAGLYVMLMIIGIIVMFGILNTVLMSVLERVKEFGVLLAVGMTPWRLAALVFSESLFLGLFSVGAGVLLGMAFNWPMEVYGLDYAEMMGGQTVEAGGVAISAQVYSELSMVKVGYFALITFGLTLFSSLYPAWLAARLEPVEAMHHH